MFSSFYPELFPTRTRVSAMAISQNLGTAATAMLPALFFVFMEQWHKGTLPYEYQDGILDAQAVHEMFESSDPIALYAKDRALFGSLAERADFLALMREKIAAVYSLIQ